MLDHTAHRRIKVIHNIVVYKKYNTLKILVSIPLLKRRGCC